MGRGTELRHRRYCIAVAEIVQGKRAITADTALRMARYLGTSARLWLNLQIAYDLALTEARDGQRIASVVRPRAA